MINKVDNGIDIGIQYRHLLSCQEDEKLTKLLASMNKIEFETIDSEEVTSRNTEDFIPFVKYVLSLDINEQWNITKIALLYVLPYARFLNKEIIDGLVSSKGFKKLVNDNQNNICAWFVPHRKEQSYLIREDYLSSLNELFSLSYKNFVRMYQITHLMRAKDPSIDISGLKTSDFWKQEFLSLVSSEVYHSDDFEISSFFSLFNGILYFYDETNKEEYDLYFDELCETIKKSLNNFESVSSLELIVFLRISGFLNKYMNGENKDYPTLVEWQKRYPIDIKKFDIKLFRSFFTADEPLSNYVNYIVENYHFVCFIYGLLQYDPDKFIQTIKFLINFDPEIVYSYKFLDFIREYAKDNSYIPMSFYANMEGLVND